LKSVGIGFLGDESESMSNLHGASFASDWVDGLGEKKRLIDGFPFSGEFVLLH